MSALKALSQFKFETTLAPSTALGRKGYPKWVDVAKLRIDDSYQRPVDENGKRNIRRIVENFAWHKFSPLVVSPRPGGLFAIIDGQHRAIAVSLHGAIKAVPCLVMHCSHEQEAEAFSIINGNITRMQTQYLFRARLAAGDPTAKAVTKACAQAGVRIMPYPMSSDQLKVGETLAVGALTKIYSKYGGSSLTAGLRCITKVGDGNAGFVRAELVYALAWTLHANPKWAARENAVHGVLARLGIPAIFAAGVKTAASAGGGVRAAIVKMVCEALQAELGPGAAVEKLVTKGQMARSQARQREAISREQEVIRAANRPSRPTSGVKRVNSNASVKASDRDLIDQHLKTKGARKIEEAASGDTFNLLMWLEKRRYKIARKSVRSGKSGLRYIIDGKTYDADGLREFCNRIRLKEGLEPITARAA